MNDTETQTPVQFSISKTIVQCYKIRRNVGGWWADITIDESENSGRIQIASDYGEWQNYWGACGESFKKFLIGLNIHYAADKFGVGRWFDQDKTLEKLRKDASEYTEDQDDRDLLNREIDNLEDCTDSNSFAHVAYNSDNLHKLWDCGPDMITDIDPSFKRFWERVWPVFIEELKRELSTENQEIK